MNPTAECLLGLATDLAAIGCLIAAFSNLIHIDGSGDRFGLLLVIGLIHLILRRVFFPLRIRDHLRAIALRRLAENGLREIAYAMRDPRWRPPSTRKKNILDVQDLQLLLAPHAAGEPFTPARADAIGSLLLDLRKSPTDFAAALRLLQTHPAGPDGRCPPKLWDALLDCLIDLQRRPDL